MAGEKFGRMAKKWLRDKADEVMSTKTQTTTHGEAPPPPPPGSGSSSVGGKVTEAAIYRAVPGLRDAVANAEANRTREAVERDAKELAELQARPLAGVGVSVTGAVTGTWSGHLPCRIERREETSDLFVDLTPLPDAVPTIGGQPLHTWTFAVLGFTGPKRYDLNEAWHAGEAAGDPLPEPYDWSFALGSIEEGYYWYEGDGRASIIEVLGDDCRTVKLRLTMGGASGDIDITADLRLPPLPAS